MKLQLTAIAFLATVFTSTPTWAGNDAYGDGGVDTPTPGGTPRLSSNASSISNKSLKSLYEDIKREDELMKKNSSISALQKDIRNLYQELKMLRGLGEITFNELKGPLENQLKIKEQELAEQKRKAQTSWEWWSSLFTWLCSPHEI